MQNSSASNQPKTTKFDVLMLSEADVAFLNNEAPKTFEDDIPYELETVSDFNHQADTFQTQKPFLQPYDISQSDSAPISASSEPANLIFSSVSETKIFKAYSEYNSDDINEVLKKIITTEPLLTEDDLLFLVKKEYTGNVTITRRQLRNALSRNDLSSAYQRFQAYMTGN